MQEAEKKDLEARRRESAITNMYYNRYLVVRYATALLLFINLYWFLMLFTEGAPLYLFILPLSLLIGAALTMWEMALMNTRDQREAKMATIFYKMIIVVNVLLVLLSVLGHYTTFFPLLKQSLSSLLAVLILQLCGILLSIGILSRLRQIRCKSDKQYKRIQTYLASIT
ncbi:hypothetical protein ACVR05_02840 [Streptococcus caprae]|uniref:PTS cellobiose transporter subunit IIA n=1 Tax=Streptococcus caprae TaxID=1640501 RepID=A0ABV8CXJ9_9STRE